MFMSLISIVAIWLVAFQANALTDKKFRTLHSIEGYLLNETVFSIPDLRIDGFYHVSRFQDYWRDVVEEQLLLLDGHRLVNELFYVQNESNPIHLRGGKKKSLSKASGLQWSQRRWHSLLSYSKNLFVNVAASSEREYHSIASFVQSLPLNFNNIHLSYNYSLPRDRMLLDDSENLKQTQIPESFSKNVSLGEVSTIQRLHAHCQRMVRERPGLPSYVYYFHNKGSCCIQASENVEDNPIVSWRDLMNTFVVEFPSICLRALRRGYLTCGVEYQDALYAGNFWWADCHHIASLPPIEDVMDAYQAEMFLFNVSTDYERRAMFAENCGYSAFNCEGINHYSQECPRYMYRDHLIRYLQDGELGLASKPRMSGSLDHSNHSTIAQSNSSMDSSKFNHVVEDRNNSHSEYILANLRANQSHISRSSHSNSNSNHREIRVSGTINGNSEGGSHNSSAVRKTSLLRSHRGSSLHPSFEHLHHSLHDLDSFPDNSFVTWKSMSVSDRLSICRLLSNGDEVNSSIPYFRRHSWNLDELIQLLG